jgi:hypothetical protein
MELGMMKLLEKSVNHEEHEGREEEGEPQMDADEHG